MSAPVTADPKAIADRLSEKERRALLWLPGKGWSPGPAYWQVSNTVRALSRLDSPLTQSRPLASRSQGAGPILQWRLTPLGLAVRALLLSQGQS